MDGGHLLARCLHQHGVTHLFTLCGGHIQAIYDGCLDEGIRVVDFRHEQSAAFAADAWSRVTGTVGVAAVTAGPGVTNAVTALANALRAQSPMVLIGGRAPLALAGRGALQELDALETVRPITKAAWLVTDAVRIPEFVAQAFRVAAAGPPGPVYVELPLDVLFAPAGTGVDQAARLAEALGPPQPPPVSGDPDAVARAAALLERAQRPVAIVGSQIRWSPAVGREGPPGTTVAAFAERFQVPVYTNGMARGVLPRGHAHAFERTRKRALAEADVVAVFGTPLDFRLNYGEPPAWPADASIIRVDLDPATLHHNRAAAVAIHGDPGAVMRQLVAAAQRNQDVAGAGSPWLDRLREAEAEAWAKMQPQLQAGGTPVPSLRLCHEVDQALGEDAIFVGDGGDFVATAAAVCRVRGFPGRWLDPGPMGTLGIAPAFAMAARLARPDGQVVVLWGDGAFGFNGLDLEAAVRQEIPFLGVIGNDAAWTQIRRGQVMMYGEDRAVATALSLARYDLVAEAFGGHGEFVTEADALRPALERALAAVAGGRPAVVNVHVDPGEFRRGAISV